MKITQAESLIMEALWRAEGPLAAEEINAAVAENWSDPTVRTLLTRLVNKKAVKAKKEGRKFLYQPIMKREDYVHAQSKDLIDRLFDGKLAPLLVQFSEREKLTKEDIAELKRLIAELDNGRR
jgi:predicted transcriptional regulator